MQWMPNYTTVREVMQFLFPQAKSAEAQAVERMTVLREQAKREGRYQELPTSSTISVPRSK